MRLLTKIIGMTFAASLALVPMHASHAQEEFSASFKNTDINEFIQAVSRNLEETIIIDPEVRGRINVRSYDVMNREQYYQFFLNVLEVYGYAVIRMDNGPLKVIRDRDAKSAPVPVVDDDSFTGDEWVTRVVPLRNVSVRELAPLLRQLNDQASGGAVMSYDPSNVIMMSGRASLINRLVQIIQHVDRAGDQDVEVVQLQHASAAEMVRIAQSVFQQQGSGIPEMMIPRIVPDERTNRILISGDPRARERVARLLRQLDTEMQTSGNTRVFYLRYAKAEDMVQLLRGMTETIIAEERATTSGSGSGTGAAARTTRRGNEVSIEAHSPTNAIVVTAQPDVLRALESVIGQLDIRRAQVLVEAIIVEVFEGDGINFGIQWASEEFGMMQHNNGNIVPIGPLGIAAEAARTRPGAEVTRVDNAGNQFTTREPDQRGDYSLLANLLGNANGLLFGTVQDGWAAVVQAVATTTNSNILSAPSITTLDNQEASILVGQEVPTITGATAGSNNDNPFQTIDRREVGIRLRVTPQINEGDAVQLLIEQEVSSIAGATSVDVTFNKRELKTTVLARDGETIVLGGLIDEDVQESLSKVPILGDIPILGHLFKSTSVNTRKRNLMIFIRPTIIRDDERMGQLSQRKYSYLRAQQLEQRERGISLRSRDTVPVLPDWDDYDALPPEYRRFLDEWRRDMEDIRKEAESGGR
ncbi:type II secretion system protein GspD [Aliidiomarina halalkaliphila]|uniref:Type II secretion system protein GspD n=1 Tax=Aliidiomarina halalkaliphila TaxID=2593535 RepID=A0A552X5Q6_9GAMM|nr:type II secretion system secretin GspD [Aliidiomarina halalkaliphila]TRW50316.1 type II secretion system protein GspD [Aliidiomarina halalkaliphila]